MYIETSSPRRQGDNAKLSRTVSLNGNSCLKFFYHMYGSSMGTLRVTVGGQKVFEQSGNKGNAWNKAELPLPGSGLKEVKYDRFPASLICG